jgi:hypothetical protein
MAPKKHRVRITLEMDSGFVRMLDVSVGLSEIRQKIDRGRQLSTIEQLALTVLYEARGAPELQVDATITRDWDDTFRVVHAARAVEELV